MIITMPPYRCCFLLVLGFSFVCRGFHYFCLRIGRRALDDARESLVEHLALLSPPSPQVMTTTRRASAPPGLSDDPDNGSTAVSMEGTQNPQMMVDGGRRFVAGSSTSSTG